MLNASWTPGSYQIYMAGASLCAPAESQEKRHDMILECVAVRDACNAIPSVAITDACHVKACAVHPKFLAPGGQATFLIYAQCAASVKA
ncbi:hypothetical protein TALK_06120 [Thalassospira alkalitolerans]|uniref:Uncharacterized protein n=1 Tax=Thalassospira alkalitolerans TaxID=1293890 RepID=A0A1Y2LGS1_9PROT|nr:hypothetical protein TALK_06120 [Thalassospira alkalitolerans]